MSIDKEKLRSQAEAATRGSWKANPGSEFWTIASMTRVVAEVRLPYKASAAQEQADATFIAAASPSTVVALLDEVQELRMLVKEMDLLFGRTLLGMRGAVIEWQNGKGADAAMHWIWNGLAGPGELPPEEETQAQAYFDREVVKIEEGLEEVYAYRDKRRAEKAKERGL